MKWIKIEDATPEQLEEEVLGIDINKEILFGYYFDEDDSGVDDRTMIYTDEIILYDPTHIIPKSELMKIED